MGIHFHFCNCVIISANDFYSVTFAQCLRTTVRRGFLCSEGDLSSKDQCRKHQTYSEWQITGTYSVLERATWFEGVNIEKIPKERKSDIEFFSLRDNPIYFFGEGQGTSHTWRHRI